MSGTREVAERIAADLGYQGGWQNQQALTEAIDKALQAEREQAAQIAAAHLSDYRNNLSPCNVAAALRAGGSHWNE